MSNSRTPEFKNIYANSMGYTLGENDDVRIGLGRNDPDSPGVITEDVAVYMTLKSARFLADSLNIYLNHAESKYGKPVTRDEAKLENFAARLGATLTSST